MKFASFFVFVLVLFFPTIASAEYKYIKVTSTPYQEKLWLIKAVLNEMGLRMTFSNTKKTHIVHSGPYKTYASAEYALNKIQRYFPSARIMGPVKTYEPPVVVRKPRKVVKRRAVKESSIIDDMYMSASLGYGYTPSTYIVNNGSDTAEMPSNSSLSYGLELGYKFNRDYRMALSYLNANATDVSFSNIYMSGNYLFESFSNMTPYIGLILGYSQLKWNTSPMPSSEFTNSSSSSMLTGTQIGLLYPFSKQISVYTAYQFVLMNHVTYLPPPSSKSELQHNSLHNLQIGLQYNF